MKILFDCDGVLNNFQEHLLTILNKKHNTNYKIDNITYYDWLPDTFDDCWVPIEERTFWDTITVYQEAVSTIESLVKQGNTIYLVTASHFTPILGYKINKILSHFDTNLVGERNVIVAKDKSMIMGDVLVDDFPKNLDKFTYGKTICFAQPWNVTYQRTLRTNSWPEIYKYIQQLK